MLALAAGCSSFLEEDLKSSLAPDNTYTSTMGFEVGSAGLYSMARSEYNTYGEQGAFMHNGACPYAALQIATDICLQSGAKDGSLTPFADLNMTSTTKFVGSYWNWAYSLINSANELLLYSEQNDNWDYPTDKALYQAEARFFRAYGYRTLVYLYGDVPWVETIKQPFELNFTRDPKEEVLGHIIDDLKFASENLPENPDGVKTGKLTKWAALHLLAEMYNFRGWMTESTADFEEAEKCALAVIESGYFELVKARYGAAKNEPGDYFSDMFVENNQNRTSGNRESIWVMQFEYKTTGGGTPSDDWTRREWGPQYHSITAFFEVSADLGGRGIAQIAPMKWWIGIKNTNATNGTDPADTEPEIEPDNITADGIFDADDIRNSEYNIKREWLGNKEPNVGVQCQITDNYWYLGYLYPSIVKFHYAHADDPTHTGSYKDRVKFRLAETYLLLAEAYLGQNDPASAADAVNEVRSRAKATPVSSDDMDIDYLLDERIRELVGEESRRFTLVRFGADVYVDRVKKHNKHLSTKVKEEHALWPIPQSIRDANRDVEFPQNPGY